MTASNGNRVASRSRSPVVKEVRNGDAKEIAACNGDALWQKGSPVQFFYMADPTNVYAQYIAPTRIQGPGPRLLQSHGWVDAVLEEDFSPEGFDHLKRDSWPLLKPRQDMLFTDRTCSKPGMPGSSRRIHFQYVRKPSCKAPLLSVVFVRWGGEDAVTGPNSSEESNDGDWGTYGCPACDEYMSSLVGKGLLAHPRLGGGGKKPLCKFELFSLFVKNSHDVAVIGNMAHWITTCLKGKKTAAFWMLWPAEWEDFKGSDYAAYIDRHTFFAGMRACEAAGLRTAFPHPAEQYEQITSKSWMATLALHPQARLPAATKVSKGNVLSNPKESARAALATLEFIRRQNPFPVEDGEAAAPSSVNKDGVKKGVVKLGWSWEARFVQIFHSEDDLAVKLTDMLTQRGCTAHTCIVQEWVDFDFEMRLYFLPPEDWQPGTKLQPTRVECNAWSGSMENGERRSFHKLSKAKILQEYWNDDEEALKSAKKQAITTAQFLLAWLLLNDAQPVPMIRLDFMVLRLSPGKARVVFGEYCEMGACCLGWEEGPPTIWEAAVTSALK